MKNVIEQYQENMDALAARRRGEELVAELGLLSVRSERLRDVNHRQLEEIERLRQDVLRLQRVAAGDETPSIKE